MSEDRTVKKVFKNIPEEKRSIGKPRKKWLDDVENDLKKTDVKRLEKNSQGQRRLEIDPEGGQGRAWTVEPVEVEQNISVKLGLILLLIYSSYCHTNCTVYSYSLLIIYTLKDRIYYSIVHALHSIGSTAR